ncbi:MAG: hypothetical protein CUN55_09870 [Phototrophicales bacterium]|nr:MAG: hypothetical protein CUN55_09870 [Phototrophicales bacterium]
MLKTLRLPLLALLFSIMLLGLAVILRFTEDSNEDASIPENATQQTSVVDALPESTVATPITTPVPTLRPVSNVLPPIAGQLTEGLVGNINKLNPLFAGLNPVDQDISSLIFEGLTTTNDFGEVVPDLAERWEVSRDGLEYVFVLRRDVLWHDGLPFTSADVAYTINVIRDASYQGDAALKAFWRTVEMTIIDDYTLRFRLVQPLALFPEMLKMGIVPAHVLEGYPVDQLEHHPFNLDPIGTGPYQVEELYAIDGQLSISLRVAPVYRQRPEGQTGFQIDRILFRTYETTEEALAALVRGEINSLGRLEPSRLTSLNGITNLTVYSRPLPSVGVLIYNWQRDDIPYLSNSRLHLAFAKGINREEAVLKALGGQVILANSPLIPGSWAYDGTARYPTYDVEAARETLSTVSFEIAVETPVPSPDEVIEQQSTETPSETSTESPTVVESPTPQTISLRRNFTILVINEPEYEALADALAQQFSALDFSVEVEAVDEELYFQRLKAGDFDTAIVEYSFAPYADPDPYAFWHSSQAEDGVNYGGVNDARLNELMERGRREHLGGVRAQIYRDFQQVFVERVPALILYYPLYTYVIDSRLDGIKIGFLSTPADRFRHIQDWTWQLSTNS